jgi:iron complex outermembrane receptor protein
MFRYSVLAAAVAAAVGPMMIAPAHAQSAGQQLERVEVTGSLLRRVDAETALPVTIIPIEELTKAGVTNAEQAMKFITQQQGATVSSGSVSAGNGAASYASLRNLGPGRTLVLLNGRRIVSNPFASAAVDLNTLPMVAVSRIEVLTDGASAIYGTDAIAGVINFITRRDYQGLEVGADAQIPQESGGELYTAKLLGGYGSLSKQGWNVYGGFNYRKQDPMLGTDREFSRRSVIPERGFNAASPTTFPANWSQTVSGVTTVGNANPFAPGCQPPTSIPVNLAGSTTTPCWADTQGFTWTVPGQEQWSFLGKGTLALGTEHNVSLEYFRAYNKIDQQIAPSPEGGLTLGPNSPFYPGNGLYPGAPGQNTSQPITVSWRTTALGPRKTETDNTTQRVVAALDGRIAGFDYTATALWSQSEIAQNFKSGYGATTSLLNGMAGSNGAPFLNPFGPQSAAGQTFLESTQITGKLNEGKGTLQQINGVLSRQFLQLPGGPIGVALLANFQKEEMEYRTDVAKASQTSSSGIAGSAPLRKGDRDVSSLGAEAVIPVLKSLEFGVALRYDKYSDFGSTTNPKVSFKFTPLDMLVIRGSYNTGFAAPSLTNLYLPGQTTFTSGRYNDPVLCPGGTVNTAAGGISSRDCGIQFQQLQGGNEQLKPEESRAWTLGFVMQPTAQLSFGADYWRYLVKESISTIGEATIFGSPSTYASLFVRCSQAGARAATIPGCRTPGGDPLAYIVNTNQNLGRVETDGLDLNANWNSGATRYGRFNLGSRATYVSSYRFQVVRDGAWFYPVDDWTPQLTTGATSGGPVIRWNVVSTIGWQTGGWSTQLANRYSSGYTDQNSAAANTAPFRNNRVDSYSLWDLGFSYTGFKNLTLRGGILNVLDTDPPYTNQTARFQARAYDDRWHNPLGRTFTFGAEYKFF